MAIRVVLADDSRAVRDVLAEILKKSPEIDLVALADDEPTLLAAIEAFRPDVVVTDVRMPPTGTDEGVRVAELLATTWTEHDGNAERASPTYHERLRPYVEQCQAFALEGAPIMVPLTQEALDERNATFREYAAKFASEPSARQRTS